MTHTAAGTTLSYISVVTSMFSSLDGVDSRHITHTLNDRLTMTLSLRIKESIHPHIVTLNDVILECNEAFVSAFGYRPSEVLGLSFSSLQLNEPTTLKRISHAQQFKHPKTAVSLLKHANGSLCPIQVEQSHYDGSIDADKKLTSIRVLQHNDQDPITGLPMGWIIDIHAVRFFQNRQDNQNLGYAIVRVDNFGSVNIRYDYGVGDSYLVKVSQLLKEVLGLDWLVVRFSGAKFGLLHVGDAALPNNDYQQYIESCCQQLCDLFSRPLEVDGNQIRKNISIGANSNAGLYEDFKALDLATEVAFMTSQRSNRSNYTFADASEQSDLLRRKLLIDDLPLAVENGDITLVYQPLYHVASERIIGFEALARWFHKNLGNISPIEFIGIAEQTGYYLQFDLYILRQVCEQRNQWSQQFGEVPPIAVNFSAKTFQINALDKMVEQVLRETQCPPEAIEIEITETAEITHYNDMFTNIIRMQKLGLNMVLDDFGAGYCSLHMLRMLADKVSKIKVDRQFIHDITNNDFNQLLFRQIIEMSQLLQIKVLAEGIEEKAQLALLDDYGCHFAQGYYLHCPVPAEALVPLLQQLQLDD